MPRFSANLSTMFREHPFLERPAAARRAGFDCVEAQFPYDEDLDAVADALESPELELSVLNVPAGDFATGGYGNAALPDRQADFRAGVAIAKRYADRVRPMNVNILAGTLPDTADIDACRQALAENLYFAAGEFQAIGIGVVVEAINTVDRPGFLLSTPEQVVAAIDFAGHANLSMEFDLYHMRMMELPLVETYRKHAARIGHIQFADAPGRNEPGTGDIDFAEIFAAIDGSGYEGRVAAEYFPAGKTEDGLGWLADYA